MAKGILIPVVDFSGIADDAFWRKGDHDEKKVKPDWWMP